VHYPWPLHLQPAFSPDGYKEGDFLIAEEAARGVLSLPMGPGLNATDQGVIVATLTAMQTEPVDRDD
jgi:dTDP-4-amino-4,6-dideoxygalactose transaminase